MNGTVLAIVGLRAAALAVALAGQSKASDSLYTLADLVESGQVTDAHMALVAEKLKTRKITDADWTDVLARIDADSKRLQSSR